MSDHPMFSLLPCVKCQAPAGWGVYNVEPKGYAIRCHLCGNEVVSDEGIMQAVEVWNHSFATALQAAQQEMARQQTEAKLRAGVPLGGPRIVPGR